MFLWKTDPVSITFRKIIHISLSRVLRWGGGGGGCLFVGCQNLRKVSIRAGMIHQSRYDTYHGTSITILYVSQYFQSCCFQLDRYV